MNGIELFDNLVSELEVRNVSVVDLRIPQLRGFSSFISAWIVETNFGIVVVDPGPSCTIDFLTDNLFHNGIDSLLAVLITHIHIDHCGGVGKLLKSYPKTPVFLNQSSHKHLIDPDILTAGSKKALGENLVSIYGPILPVDPNLLYSPSITKAWKTVSTPGHSADHLCYCIGKYLFAGEALGVSCPSSSLYLRPATPKRFFYNSYKSSISNLASVNFDNICLAHYGQIDSAYQGKSILNIATEQIDLWVDLIKKNLTLDDNTIIDLLSNYDSLFKNFNDLDINVKARESIFIINSIKGIKEFLAS